MSELCLLAAVSLATAQSPFSQATDLAHGTVRQPESVVPSSHASDDNICIDPPHLSTTNHPTPLQPQPEFSPSPPSNSIPSPHFLTHPPTHPLIHSPPSPPKPPRPSSGRQFFQQRRTALQAGQSYTRIEASRFSERWLHSTYEPSHEDWLALLSREAQAMAGGQGDNRLTVMVGDSISLWFPPEYMPRSRFWLNQSISGDTATGTLQRLSFFEKTNPDMIHVMIGINDLRQGVSDQQLLATQQQIIRRLRQQHPQARVMVHSLLPTRLESLPGDRIRRINAQLEAIALQEGAQLLNLHRYFVDESGQLNAMLTTDGLHLNEAGYALWYSILNQTCLTCLI